MNILAISTSSKTCSVALLNNEKLIKESSVTDEFTHSINLMPCINNVLKSTNTHLEEIDLLACNIGPGSFTGIRIGIATIIALSSVTHIPTIGISSLLGLAYSIESNDIICSVIDANNNNLYCAFFDKNKHLINDYFCDTTENIENIIKEKYNNNKIVFVGNGSTNNKNEETAVNIGIAAFNEYSTSVHNNTLIPLYLRKTQAERMFEDKNGD